MIESNEQKSAIAQWVGCQVVVDTDSSYVYIGNLDAVHNDCLLMSNVDAHDTTDTRSTKEFYTHESKIVGTRHNRKLTLVRLARVVSVCKLDDVITF